MLDMANIEKICLDKGLTKMSISSFPTFVNSGRDEGIEIKGGKILNFWIVSGVRDYKQPPSDKIKNIIYLLDNVETPETEEKKSIVVSNANGVYIPESITKELLEKWQSITTFERMLMFQNTAKEYIKQRPQGNRKSLSYVEGNIMQQEANIAFLFNWSDFITDKVFDNLGCSVFGGVIANIDGHMITHTAIGIDKQEFTRDDKKPVFTVHELFKNAHTDMIKKALSKFGFNGDVYRGEV